MYLKITNGLPQEYSIEQLRQENQQTSFPESIDDEMLASYGVYSYSRPTVPNFDHRAWRLIDDDFMQNSDGQWFKPYKLEPLSYEQAALNVRNHRNTRLMETDWVVIKAYENNLEIAASWAAYRQSLRDITEQSGFPFEVIWPAKPE